MQFLQFLKLCGMLLWRLFLIHFVTRAGFDFTLVTALAIGAAAFTVFGFNRTVVTWPIVRGLFRREPVIRPASADGFALFERRDRREGPHSPGVPGAIARGGAVPRRPVAADAPVSAEIRALITHLDTQEVIPRAGHEGLVTGFEPHALVDMPLPTGPYMVGTPGGGLQEASGLGEAQVRAGVTGEENFAKALARTGLLDRFQTIWSVRVPDAERLRVADYAADIDCVIPTAQGLLLVDIKLYAGGAVRYYSADGLLYTEDIGTGKLVREPVSLSTNMRDATHAIRGHFPEVPIIPVVVFLPSDRGQGELVDVHWPGAIPARALGDFLYWLSTLSAADAAHPVQLAADRLAQLR